VSGDEGTVPCHEHGVDYADHVDSKQDELHDGWDKNHILNSPGCEKKEERICGVNHLKKCQQAVSRLTAVAGPQEAVARFPHKQHEQEGGQLNCVWLEQSADQRHENLECTVVWTVVHERPCKRRHDLKMLVTPDSVQA
jgi:hypothetical protein